MEIRDLATIAAGWLQGCDADILQAAGAPSAVVLPIVP
jgi:hypothetical protein